MLQFKKNLLIASCAIFTFSACKNSNGTTTEAAVSTTTPDAAPTPTPAPAPATASLAAKLSKFKEVQLPFVVNTKTDIAPLTPLTDVDMEGLESDYGFTINAGNGDNPKAGFRAKIDDERQILAVLYDSEGMSASLQNVQFRIFKNDGTAVGETAEFTYLHSMSNQYAAGETNLDITINADKITTKGIVIESDPMGEKDDKKSNAKPTTTLIGVAGLPKLQREF